MKDESRGVEVGIVISEGKRVDMEESRNIKFCRSESIGVPFDTVKHSVSPLKFDDFRGLNKAEFVKSFVNSV